jgi:murein DD-endopeptidase MepM/ murein hydrolase activator NlpD
MKNLRIHSLFLLCIPLGLLVVTAFVSPSSTNAAFKEIIYSAYHDSLSSVVATAPEPTSCLLDTANVYEKYWNNTNLFSYSYPAKAPIPDSVYFVMCDSEIEFCIPRNGGINSPYGPRWGTMHKGLDIHLERGDIVRAAMPGKVRYAQFNTGGYGNLVVLRHPNGLETYYAHLTAINVTTNSWVDAGDILGTGGNSGAEWTGEHLHFEMRYRDHAFDPLLIIDWAKKELKSDTLVVYKKNLYFSESASNASMPQAAEKRTGQSSESQTKKSNLTSSYKRPAYHTVRAGDTLYSIARKNSKSVSRIIALNGLPADATLQIGQRIRLD